MGGLGHVWSCSRLRACWRAATAVMRGLVALAARGASPTPPVWSCSLWVPCSHSGRLQHCLSICDGSCIAPLQWALHWLHLPFRWLVSHQTHSRLLLSRQAHNCSAHVHVLVCAGHNDRLSDLLNSFAVAHTAQGVEFWYGAGCNSCTQVLPGPWPAQFVVADICPLCAD